jgi:hypothetical protein
VSEATDMMGQSEFAYAIDIIEALLIDSQVPETSTVSYTDYMFIQLQRLHNSRARHFVIFNAAPLHLAPLYRFPRKKGKVIYPY